ncbi:hypothetical protein [Arthrobacter sp. Br18]|uniref:hypothetical protein n=1 Tax=Arthrobacter sp. Br18 TaxID=1312954 RepID=UPI0004B7C7DB|nr:hypothetical protein [Arthrobacter sp. Br18]
MTSDEAGGRFEQLRGGRGLKNALRRVFDTQIPNYGDYNLVFASHERGEGDARPPLTTVGSYVLGYRRQPAEIMMAPVEVSSITGAGTPVEVNMTNLAHALRWDDGSYEVGTSTGRIFRFRVRAQPTLDVGPGNILLLEQDEDVIDFDAFMEAFIAMA